MGQLGATVSYSRVVVTFPLRYRLAARPDSLNRSSRCCLGDTHSALLPACCVIAHPACGEGANSLTGAVACFKLDDVHTPASIAMNGIGKIDGGRGGYKWAYIRSGDEYNEFELADVSDDTHGVPPGDTTLQDDEVIMTSNPLSVQMKDLQEKLENQNSEIEKEKKQQQQEESSARTEHIETLKSDVNDLHKQLAVHAFFLL